MTKRLGCSVGERLGSKDPIQTLARKDLLDDAQVRAAHVIRQAVEKLSGGGGCIDLSRMRVDCAGAGDPTLYMLEAAELLGRIRAAVGPDYANIVIRVAGYGEGPAGVARAYVRVAADLANGGADRASRGFVIRALQRGLDLAALELGIARPGDVASRDYVSELLG